MRVETFGVSKSRTTYVALSSWRIAQHAATNRTTVLRRARLMIPESEE
jgi:hypothetical protein